MHRTVVSRCVGGPLIIAGRKSSPRFSSQQREALPTTAEMTVLHASGQQEVNMRKRYQYRDDSFGAATSGIHRETTTREIDETTGNSAKFNTAITPDLFMVQYESFPLARSSTTFARHLAAMPRDRRRRAFTTRNFQYSSSRDPRRKSDPRVSGSNQSHRQGAPLKSLGSPASARRHRHFSTYRLKYRIGISREH